LPDLVTLCRSVRLAALLVVIAVVGSSVVVLATPHEGAASAAGSAPSGARPAVSYLVTFSESGLPANLNWQISFGRSAGSYDTDGGTDYITFTVPAGNYSYSITDLSGYHQTTLPYTGYVLVTSSPVTEPTLAYVQVTYPVTFSESGLPASLEFNVTLNGTLQSVTTDGGTDSATFEMPNGSFSYAIADISGWHQTTLPYTGSVLVSGAGVTETTVVFHQVTYSVSFSESGLPSALSWQVTFAGTPKSLTTNGATDTLTWTGVANGTHAYSVTDISGWHQSTLAYSGNVVVSGSSVSEPTLGYSQVTYTITFTESALPSGLTWKVTVGHGTQSLTTDGGNDSLSFVGGNATYSYSITDISGWHQLTLPYTGSIVVNGSSVSEPTLVYQQISYTVTFAESGLPVGTNWSVTLNGTPENSTTTSIAFVEPNGTYSYQLGLVPGWHSATSSGTVHVTGSGPTVAITFTRVTYTVTFTESPFAAGPSWSVTLNGTNHASTTTTVTFAEPNGTFAYSIGLVSGWVPVTPSGSVVVAGTTVNVAVAFSQVKYTVTFTESGLPRNAPWSVSFGGTRQSTTHTSLVFGVANGTYTYLIAGPYFWQVSVLAPEGSLHVAGASLSQPVQFLHGGTSAVGFREVGLALGSSWCVTVGWQTCSTHALIVYRNLTPATYQYAVASIHGLVTVVKLGTHFEAPSGSVIVPPATTYVVRYSQPVTFTESGLNSGTSWAITSGGLVNSSTSNTIVIDLINGTYGFSVHAVTGFLASPSTGHYRVSGAPVALSIHFVARAALPRGGATVGSVVAAVGRLVEAPILRG
jgi:hypothetical protein